MVGFAGGLAYIKGRSSARPASRLPRQRLSHRHGGRDRSAWPAVAFMRHAARPREGIGAPIRTPRDELGTPKRPSANPDPICRKCRQSCAQNSDQFGGQLPPESQCPLVRCEGESHPKASCRQTRRPRNFRCRGKSIKTSALTVGPSRTTADGHVVHLTQAHLIGGLPMRPLGRMGNPARFGPSLGVRHENIHRPDLAAGPGLPDLHGRRLPVPRQRHRPGPVRRPVLVLRHVRGHRQRGPPSSPGPGPVLAPGLTLCLHSPTTSGFTAPVNVVDGGLFHAQGVKPCE